jgi:hypothetical protein
MGALLNKQTQGFLRLLIAQARVASLGAYYGDPKRCWHGKGVSSLLGYSFAPKIRVIRKRAVSHGAEILIHGTFESSWPRHYDMRKADTLAWVPAGLKSK